MVSILRKVSTKKRMMIAAALVLVVAGAAGRSMYAAKQPAAPAGQIVQVSQGDITAVISATGTIKPVNMVDVSSKISGLVKEVRVNENDLVTPGQVLLTLDDTHLQAQVAQARARLADARATYDRTAKLTAIGANSVQQLDTARTNHDVAQASYEDSMAQLGDTVIRAPISGRIIGKPIPAGQTVAPGISTPMVLMTIADMSKMQIDMQVDESDIGRVEVGQPVHFTVDAYPGKTFDGSVARISQKANVQQNVVYYDVTVDVNGGGDVLKSSMTARASIIVGERKGVLSLPLAAVKTANGKAYVVVPGEGDKTRNVNVTTGLTGEDRIEITSGLTEGDRVLMPQVKQQNAATGRGGLFPGGPGR